MGLLDTIKDVGTKAYNWYKEQDTPLSAHLRGDDVGEAVNRSLDQNLSLLQTPEGAMDWVNPMAKVGGLLGTFIGKGSKLWNPTSYTKALEMEKAGAKAEDIWKETGNVKYADGQWRQEISDKDATVKADFIVGSGSGGYYDAQSIGELLDHPQLFKAYPDAKNVDFSQTASKDWDGTVRSGASYSPKSTEKGIEYPHRITLYEDRLVSPVATKTSVLHENQHYIQELENFAKGGDPFQFIKEFEKARKPDMAVITILNKEMDKLVKEMDALKQTKLSAHVSEWDKIDAKIAKLKDEHDIFLTERQNIAKNNNEDLYTKGFDEYHKLAGEAEARLTQKRGSLTDAERRAHFPYEYGTDYGLDVPFNELVVQGILSK